MKKLINSLFLVGFVFSVLTIAGCGDAGGTAGDENDPANDTDTEMMDDETGDGDNPEAGGDGSAGAV